MRTSINALGQDVAHALRGLLRHPFITGSVVLMLALAIGVNAAVFAALNSIVLQPLPFRDPAKLVKIDQYNPRSIYGIREGGTWQQWQQWRLRNSSFEDIAAYTMGSHELGGVDQPQRLLTLNVSDNFFPLIGAAPLLGRVLNADDYSGDRRQAVISYRLWKTSFGGDSNIVGSTISLSQETYTVIGVMPQRFHYPPFIAQIPGAVFDVWQPIPQTAPPEVIVVGRLEQTASLAAGEADLNLILAQQVARPDVPGAGWHVGLSPLPEQVTGTLGPLMWLLFLSVTLVLFVASANVSSILLARNRTRLREYSVRVALGATTGRILRISVIDSLLLSGSGALLGLHGAHALITELASRFPEGIPRVDEIAIDGQVVCFAAGAALVTTLCSLLPLLFENRRFQVSATLKDAAGGLGISPRMNTWLSRLLSIETAVSTTLLIGTGALLSSVDELVNRDFGFDAKNVLTMRVQLSPTRYQEWDRIRALHLGLQDEFRGLSGVEDAALALAIPLSGRSLLNPVTLGNDPEATRAANQPVAEFNIVTPSYFSVFRSRLLSGRLFDEESDRENAPPVAIVNRAAAERFWQGKSPLGRVVQNSAGYLDDVPRVVVGVVGDEQHWDLWTQPEPKIFIPYSQVHTAGASRSFRVLTFALLRTSQELAASDRNTLVRAAMDRVDPLQPIVGLNTMSKIVDDSMASQRFALILFGLMGSIAFVFSCTGVYGVSAFAAYQRAREFGLRQALGATAAANTYLLLRRVMAPVLLGTIGGVIAAMLLSHLLQSQLSGMREPDFIAFLVAPAVLLLSALLSCLPLLSKISSVQPLTLLQEHWPRIRD